MTKKRLTDFRPSEVSFVKKGANRKKRYLTKSENTMDIEKLAEAIKKAELDMDAIQSDVQKSLGESISDDAVGLLSSAMAIVKSVKSMMPENSTLALSFDGIHTSVYKAEEVEAIKAEHTKELEVLKSELEATKAQIQKAEPTEPELSDIAKAEILKREEEIQILKSEVAKIHDEKLTISFISKAEKELPRMGESEKVGTLLKNISKSASEDDYKQLEEMLKNVHAVLEGAADITKELGTTTKEETLEGEAKVQKLAEVYKSENPTVTIEQARVHIRKTHPELTKTTKE